MGGKTGKCGGIGEFLPPSDKHGFGLKIVRLLRTDGTLNGSFWSEAQSVHSYCSAVRFLGGTLKIPMAAHYYIKRDSRQSGSEENRNGLPPKTPGLMKLIHNCFITLSESKKRSYEGYEPLNSEELQTVYRNKTAADLLMVYPVVYGGEKNLTSWYCNKSFSAKDVEDLIIQILSAIIGLYQSGRAHGDIKPENIMVSRIGRKKVFRLTDFGSIYDEAQPSGKTTGTAAFFDPDLYKTILARTGSNLTARLYTDCYALTRTVIALVLGKHPGPLASTKYCVPGRWPEIRPLWEKIYKVEDLTIEDIKSIIAEYRIPAGEQDYQPLDSYCDEFEYMQADDSEETVYGTLHEQIRFSAEFDPLMKVYGINFYSKIFRQIPEFYLPPLIRGWDEYEHKWLIFHAPDDAGSGKPPQDFRHYMPRSLVNTAPTAEEQKLLIRYGKKLDKYFAENPTPFYWLPEKKHLLWVNGKLKWLYGHGTTVKFPIRYEACFRFLISGKADSFDDRTRLALLPYYEELHQSIQDEDCEKLREKLFSRKDLVFRIAKFRKFAVEKADELSAEEWLVLWPKIPELATRLDTVKSETVFEIFKKADAEQTNLLLKSPHTRNLICRQLEEGLSAEEWLALWPKIPDLETRLVTVRPETVFEIFKKANAEQSALLLKLPPARKVICRQIAEEPVDQRIGSFFLMREFDEKTFLRFFSENDRSKITKKQWCGFIQINPALFRFMPERLAAALQRKDWVRLLGAMPEMAERCPKLNKFTSSDWASLLIQQPKLRKFLPSGICFSRNELDRLKKKQIF